jgi:single-strand DNA-binding protein
MAYLNRVFLMGNLTRDPEVRYIPSGKAVADLGIAINRRYRTTSGEDKEETCFVDAVVWEKQAETAGKYLKKGSCILVEGSLQFDQWETNGEKRSKLRVRVDRFQFMDRKPSETGDAPSDIADQSRRRTIAPQESPGDEPTGEGQADNDDLPF